MTRTFETLDLVTLPRLDSIGAVALSQSLETAAEAYQNLPESLTKAIGWIAGAREALQLLVGGDPLVSITIKQADRDEDTAIVALCTLLVAWGKLKGYIPQGEDAEQARLRLFGDGLEFVNWKVEKEWAIVNSKIAIIDTPAEGILPILQSLGAMPMLEHLRKVHATYGNTIGTTQVPEESPAIREKRDALLERMRIYVVRVSASVEPDDPGTKERADALLRPLKEWRGNPSAPRPVPGEPEGGSQATTEPGTAIPDKPAGT